MKYVIIGAGAAGISAVKTIREHNSADEIVVISADDSVYSRCMLHNYISGDRDEKKVSFISEDFFAKHSIRWLNGKTVIGIDTDNKLVNLNDGNESFDRLLIATGSDSIKLPLLQSQGPKNVFGLRHLSDAKAIREQAKNAKNIVIVGAGLAGMDTAYALIEMGKKPVIVDISNYALALNLDEYTSNVYKNKFEEAGCTFYLGKKVTAVETGDVKNLTSLTLDSGEKLPCDLVVVTIGSHPAVSFLAGSKIACDKGVIVNEYLATNIEGIYAAGDVTDLSGIWHNAVKQGEIAAKNMCGITTPYEDMFAIKNTINYFGITSLSLGKVEPNEFDISIARSDKNRYEKFILHDDVIIGVLLQGSIAHSGFWQYLIKNHINVSKINKPIYNLSFADFYGIKENGEYEWVV